MVISKIEKLFQSNLLVSISAIFLFSYCSSTKNISLQKKPIQSITGSEFYQKAANMDLTQRDSFLLLCFKDGNMPSFFTRFRALKENYKVKNKSYRVKYFVSPDYLMIGNNNDYFRVPVTPAIAQQMADDLHCFLPTSHLVDLIYQHSNLTLEPIPLFAYRDSFITFWHHHLMIEGQLKGKQKGIVAGIKKDVIICSEEKFKGKSNRVAIYGWHKPDGKPIQPVYTGHSSNYVDYSHGARFIHSKIRVNGKIFDYQKILTDSVMYRFITNESNHIITRYPYSLNLLK